LKAHPELRAIRDRVGAILETDPYNLTRRSDIKKLGAVPEGEGQWRLALGRFRFRYDIADQEIVLHYCGLRREDTYRD
jgi:mRNA-degrading endonuclease RelE of RelBE toxin-antitoxin system